MKTTGNVDGCCSMSIAVLGLVYTLKGRRQELSCSPICLERTQEACGVTATELIEQNGTFSNRWHMANTSQRKKLPLSA
jgi:hypothetical protein